MPDCLWERTLAGLWTAVKADAGIVGVMGTTGKYYEFLERSLLLGLNYDPAHCPLLAIAPAAEGCAWRPARRRRGPGIQDVLALTVDMATAGQARAPILNFAQAFRACVEDNIAGGFGLAAAGPEDAEYAGISFQARPNEQDLVVSWSCSFTLSLRYRSDE